MSEIEGHSHCQNSCPIQRGQIPSFPRTRESSPGKSEQGLPLLLFGPSGFPRTDMTCWSQRKMKMLLGGSGATDVFRPAGLIRASESLFYVQARMSPTKRGTHPWHQISQILCNRHALSGKRGNDKQGRPEPALLRPEPASLTRIRSEHQNQSHSRPRDFI
jgi:hypothetical protein